MQAIKLGEGSTGTLQIDLDVLIRTRALIQANSGGGKSYLLRKFLESVFGKVQAIVIDPEGEFSTLREKFGYVLVGKDGETPADVRSAGMVAEKLLELGASAVCDLYDVKPYDRPRWVKAFLDGLMNSPKELWHPVVIAVDEAHKFCPERGKGEAESTEAMLSLATAGRKRGFCAVFATQRLGKLNKDAAAELLNVLIGRTFLDIDRDRAAEILGIDRAGRAEFDTTLRNLVPGQFFSLGPAMAREKTLFMVGKVQTTHPEVGMGMKTAFKTPTPNEVKAMLPKLADLPKHAEEKARTIEQLQHEIRSLRGQLSAKPKAEPDPAAIQRAVDNAVRECERKQEQRLKTSDKALSQMKATLGQIAQQAAKAAQIELPEVPVTAVRQAPAAPVAPKLVPRTVPVNHTPANDNGGELSGPERRILNSIAWLNSIGVEDPEQTAVAFLAGYTIGGGGYNNPRGSLNTKGLVQYLPGDHIRLTDAGRSMAQTPETPLDAQELQRMVLERLPGPEQKILRVLIEAYPHAITNEECAERSGYTNGGGGYNNPRGRLRTLGLIDYQTGGRVIAKPLLFLEQ